jgi:mono/diheme cytochrome c family protein
MKRRYILVCMFGVTVGLTFSAIAQELANSTVSSSAAAPAATKGISAAVAATPPSAMAKPAADGAENRAQRLEGEKRFRTNCGRCHQAPHKFPPRVMATAIRHMRVRAMITDEDMRLILRYMTQ